MSPFPIYPVPDPQDDGFEELEQEAPCPFCFSGDFTRKQMAIHLEFECDCQREEEDE